MPVARLNVGYQSLLLRVSLFMKNRTDDQRVEDEKTLVVLSNRLAKTHCLPVWTICSAQQTLESKMGVKNIIANDRLKNVALLQDESNFYDIVLSRVRTITQPNSIEPYFEDYRKGFTWPDAIGSETFQRFFPFYKPAIDVLRAVSYNLTTLRSAVHFMHQILKTQRKAKSNELITLWQMFDDVVSYEEDPSGTTAGIAAISSKFNDDWKAYQAGRRIIGQATKGRLKVYASRCEKIQAFDEVTGKCEEVRSRIDSLPGSRQFKAVEELAQIDALASINVPTLKDELACYKDGLFQSAIDRNGVERGLKDRSQPEGCSLHVDEAEAHIAAAEDALTQASGVVRSALVNMASLLRQPALRSLLEQGRQEKFIADVLAATNDEKLADLLAECIPADPGNAKLLAKHLKKIVVKVVRLQDFRPAKTKIEKGDIETVVGEFRQFLETAVDGDGKGQSTILEIK